MRYWRSISLGFWACLAPLATGMMQKLLQFSLSDQLVQMVPQISTIFCSMSLVLVILAIKVLIALHGVSCHLIWPFKEWFILNILQNLMHWFPEHRVNCLSIGRPWLPSKVPSRSIVVVSVRPEIPHLLRDNLSFPFPLLLVFLNPFILVNLIHELTHTGDRFTSQGFP